MHNESKNVFEVARTPAVFFVTAVIFYVLSGLFGLSGIYFVANLCNLTMGAAMLSLGMWAYVR
jgi:atlastin